MHCAGPEVSELPGPSHDHDDDGTPDDADVSRHGGLPWGGIGLDVLGIAEAGAASARARSLRAKLRMPAASEAKNACCKPLARLNAACVQVPSDSSASAWPATRS